MINPFKYLFHFYLYFIKSADLDIPYFIATMMVCLVQFMNLFSIYGLLIMHSELNILEYSSKTLGVFISLGIFFINYYTFLHNKNYLEIEKRLGQIHIKEHIPMVLFSVIYTIISFWYCLFIIVPDLQRFVHGN